MLRKAMLPNAMLLQLEPAGSKHSDVTATSTDMTLAHTHMSDTLF